MRQPAPTDAPVVCTIGASDASGATGIQADLKTIEAHGAYAASVVTTVTGDEPHELPAETVAAQLDSLRSTHDVAAVKVGELATAATAENLTTSLRALDCPLVVDLTGPTGSTDATDAASDRLAAATLVVTDADEADRLTGVRPSDEAGQRLAGQRLLTKGPDAALVTGARVDDEVLDTLVTPETIETATHPRVDGDVRGADDTLSAAITARLALGEPLPDAVGRSLASVQRAVRYAVDVGEEPVANHVVDLRDDAARDRVREQVEDVVAWFVERDVSPVVPEVGLQVVGATPYAESPANCAAVEGRLARVRDGVHPNRGVRFGVSEHVARFLVAAREHAPRLRYAVNCRFDDAVAAAMDELGWDWVRFEEEEVSDAEASRLEREAAWAFSGRDELPVAAADPGTVGTEPIVKVVGRDHRRVAELVVELAAELE